MSKALDNFIDNRKKFSRFPVERVAVIHKGGGFANLCIKNSIDSIDRTTGVKIMSGWLIIKTINNDCDIISHFWNISADNKHFDTTPLIDNNFEYIADPEVLCFGQENLGKLKSLTCYALSQNENNYIAIEMFEGKVVAHKIADLSNLNIFQFK
jgi:hypothetical protein